MTCEVVWTWRVVVVVVVVRNENELHIPCLSYGFGVSLVE
jgi:hypothetical protein